MRALRLGSYSMAATFAGTPSLSRRKSTTRYRCLCPPPRCRAVMRPYELRPPDFGFDFVSERSGFARVTSAKSETVWNRRPALVGLRLRIGISSAPEDLDLVVTRKCDDRPLLAGARAEPTSAAVALALALAVERVHVLDLDVEDRLDRLTDLDLVRVARDDERVHVAVVQRVRLLGHDGPDHDVARVPVHSAGPSSVSSDSAG